MRANTRSKFSQETPPLSTMKLANSTPHFERSSALCIERPQVVDHEKGFGASCIESPQVVDHVLGFDALLAH